MDMYDSLGDIQGGDVARGEFTRTLEELAHIGLCVEDDALYDDPTLRPWASSAGAIPKLVAAAGLGPAGHVSVAPSLWRKCAPVGLRAIYWHGVAAAQRCLHMHNSRSVQLHRMFMFNSIHNVTKEVKPTTAPPTASAFPRPKSSTKCRCLLNATGINTLEPRPPPKAHLPALSKTWNMLATSALGSIWMCKLDLINVYWSIRPLRRWHRTFVVRAGGRC